MALRRLMVHFAGNSLSLFVFATLAFSDPLSGAENAVQRSLDCTNDANHFVFCEFEAQNCSEYKLRLTNTQGYWDRHCIVEQCKNGRCCCTFDYDDMDLVYGETHRVGVLKGSESVASKVFDVTKTLKPRVPSITSVRESNGNFVVTWKTNMRERESLDTNLTYGKKGDTSKTTIHVAPTSSGGLNFHELPGRKLEPSTSYVISVKTQSTLSGLVSDSSEEWEFKTPMSRHILVSAVIISLSLAAILISGAMYGCYVKLKTEWWAKCPNPKLPNIAPYKQEVLKPRPPIMSSISVEPLVPDDKPWSKGSLEVSSSGSPQQSSGISTGSSSFSYANTGPVDVKGGVEEALTKTFASLMSPLIPTKLPEPNGNSESPYNPCSVPTECCSSGSSNFDNKTYMSLHPSAVPESAVEASEVQTQAVPVVCPSNFVITTYQQAPPSLLFPAAPHDPPVIAVDMPYQQCNMDSGTVLCAEDSGSISLFSGSDTVMSCDPAYRCESSVEVDGGDTKLNVETAYAAIPSSVWVPGASHGFLPVVDEGQASQTLLTQPNILFPEKRSVKEEEKILNKSTEESFTKMPQNFLNPFVSGFTNNVQDGQTHFLPAIPADMSMMADGGYHCV